METASELIATAKETAIETPTQLEPERELPVEDPLQSLCDEENATRVQIQEQHELLAHMFFAVGWLTSQRTRLTGSIVATRAALKGVERNLEALTTVYDCVQERVDVLLKAKDVLEAQIEILTSNHHAVDYKFGKLWQIVVGLRGERQELQDKIADLQDELAFVKRQVKIETAFLLAQPNAHHTGGGSRPSPLHLEGVGTIVAFWWSLVWPS